MAKNRRNNSGFIPCLYLPYLGGSSKLLIYFHGNAEDVGLAMELLAFVKDMLKVSFNKIVSRLNSLFLTGARTSHGVSRLRSLRRWTECRLNRSRCPKSLRLPHNWTQNTTLVHNSFRKIHRIRPGQSSGFFAWAGCPPPHESFYVDQRYHSWEGRRNAPISHQR